jgi:hypothetical protein
MGKSNGNCNIFLKSNPYQGNFQHHTKRGLVCPYEPSIIHLCVVGCVTFVHVPKEIKTKISKVSNAYSLVIVKRLRGIYSTTL